jgi:hypothetical protein
MLTEYNNRKTLENNEDLTNVKDDLAEVIRKISAIIRLVSETGIEISTVKGELKQLEERKHCLEAFIEEITLNNAQTIISEQMLYNLIIQSKEFILSKNISECCGFIQSYIEKVLVYIDKVEIIFKIPIPEPDNNEITLLKSEADKTTIIKAQKQVF